MESYLKYKDAKKILLSSIITRAEIGVGTGPSLPRRSFKGIT